MTAYNTELFDQYGRTIRPVLLNTAKDGSGTWLFSIVDSDGHLQVDNLSALPAGAARIGILLEDPHEVRVSKAIDASLGAYAANDVVNDDDCSVTATYWTFEGMANAIGGYGVIDFATIFDETPNISPRLVLMLFNAIPTGQLTDNSANTNPLPADRAKWVGDIEWGALRNVSATAASTQQASPSTTGGLPLIYKCAAASTTLYGVLKTLDAFTQVATNDIEIALQVRHL